MTMAWFKDAAFPGQPANRGGAPVGMMADLPVVEKGAILFLRLWCEGAQGQRQVAQDFALAFGPDRAVVETERLATLIRVVLGGVRRPLMRHGTDCQCFGGDESAFANLVAASVVGEREDAMVFALALMTPDRAFDAVTAAEGFGLAIHGLAHALSRQTYASPRPTDFTRH